MVSSKLKKFKFYIFFIFMFFFSNCDSAIDYIFVLNNQSKNNIFVKYITQKRYELSPEKYEIKKIVKEYQVKPGELITLERILKVNNKVQDYLTDWYENSGNWYLHFEIEISKNKKKYYKITDKNYWNFYIKNSHTGVYELTITDNIFSK